MSKASEAEITAAVEKARAHLCEYEIDCLVDFAGIERRDVRWGAAMSVAVESCIGLGFLTRGPRHDVTPLGKAVAQRLSNWTPQAI